MSVCLFIGPTLRPEEVGIGCETLCLPPVAQGDVVRAAQQRPRAIGIVDGYFSGAPAVWHKEILWALSQGIHVFGSASMGALRAAELHGFGMRGVGRIFEAFRDGVLEDDDEVAVVHGPAELGYPALSEAMVNIRATLARAAAEGVLSETARQRLEAAAKARHFPERHWPALLEGAGAHGVGRAEIEALREWLPQGRVDQKRADALEMLGCMQETLEAGAPAAASFHFEWTLFWDDLVSRPPGKSEGPDMPVLEELRLEGREVVERVTTGALLRRLAGDEARRLGLTPADGAAAATLRRLRAAHGLYTRAGLEAWLTENDLDARELERLVADEATLEAVRERAGPGLEHAMLDELRLSGAYPRLAERARRKAAAEGEPGAGPPPAPIELRLWYFEARLGRPMPDDIAGHARELGFATLADFDSALRREYVYWRQRRQARDPDVPDA